LFTPVADRQISFNRGAAAISAAPMRILLVMRMFAEAIRAGSSSAG
jgi:hypothetical protein